LAILSRHQPAALKVATHPLAAAVGLISNTIQCWWTYPMNR
jgi:hypothetical protein